MGRGEALIISRIGIGGEEREVGLRESVRQHLSKGAKSQREPGEVPQALGWGRGRVVLDSALSQGRDHLSWAPWLPRAQRGFSLSVRTKGLMETLQSKIQGSWSQESTYGV